MPLVPTTASSTRPGTARTRTTRSVCTPDQKAGHRYVLTYTHRDLLRRRVAVLVPQLVADLGQQLLVAELDARVERVVADDAPVARRHRDAAAARVVRQMFRRVRVHAARDLGDLARLLLDDVLWLGVDVDVAATTWW